MASTSEIVKTDAPKDATKSADPPMDDEPLIGRPLTCIEMTNEDVEELEEILASHVVKHLKPSSSKFGSPSKSQTAATSSLSSKQSKQARVRQRIGFDPRPAGDDDAFNL